jgi:hypothetical protein
LLCQGGDQHLIGLQDFVYHGSLVWTPESHADSYSCSPTGSLHQHTSHQIRQPAMHHGTRSGAEGSARPSPPSGGSCEERWLAPVWACSVADGATRTGGSARVRSRVRVCMLGRTTGRRPPVGAPAWGRTKARASRHRLSPPPRARPFVTRRMSGAGGATQLPVPSRAARAPRTQLPLPFTGSAESAEAATRAA